MCLGSYNETAFMQRGSTMEQRKAAGSSAGEQGRAGEQGWETEQGSRAREQGNVAGQGSRAANICRKIC